MKKILLFFLTLLTLPLVKAEERVWCLITDSNESIAMSEVLCLAAADDDSTFAVVLKGGTAIAGVRRAHFDLGIPTDIKKPGILVAQDFLQLTNAPAGSTVSIFSIDGKLMQQAKADEEINISSLPPHTYYIIRLGETTFKFRKP